MSLLPGAAAPCARACRLARRGLACGRTAAARRSACLAGERGPRGCRTRFPFECLAGRATAARRRFLARCGAAAGAIAGGAFACASRSAARLGRGQRDARASGFRKANRDRLLGRACTISSRTNSPAWVLGALPWALSLAARRLVRSSGIFSLLWSTFVAGGVPTSCKRHQQHFADPSLLGERMRRERLGQWEALGDRYFQ